MKLNLEHATSIAGLIQRAESASPVSVRFAGGDEANRQVEAAPPPMAFISLADELIPAAKAIAETGIAYAGLDPQKPGQVIKLSAEVMRESRFCRAGGVLIVDSSRPRKATDSSGGAVFYDSPRQFHVIEPLPFSKLRAITEAPVSAWPVSGLEDQMVSSLPSAALMSTHSARVRLTRRQQRYLPRDLWAYEVAKAIALGLAQAVDNEVFSTLDRKLNAAAWSWGWPASKNIAHDELAAVIGTSGIGAKVREDGSLTYAGLCPAELAPAVPSTLIGTFGRAAIFVDDDVRLIAKHMGVSGDLEITVLVTMRLDIPDLAYFTKPSA